MLDRQLKQLFGAPRLPMAQSVEQINQSMQALEQQARDLGEQLYQAHQLYRQALSNTALQQLTMACFTLCTEAYPQEFLALAVPQRHQLQAHIRRLAQQMQQDLAHVPHPDTTVSMSPQLPAVKPDRPSAGAEILFLDGPSVGNLSDPVADPVIDPVADPEPARSSEDKPVSPLASPSRDILDTTGLESALGEALSEVLEEAFANAESGDRGPAPRGFTIEDELRALFSMDAVRGKVPMVPTNTVETVNFWQEQVEEQTRRYLRQTSAAMNQMLQREGILPSQIPAALLEAATLTEGGDPFGKTPHLMRMVLEAREKKPSPPPGERLSDDEESNSGNSRKRRRDDRSKGEKKQRPNAIVPLVAVQLRLAELEFHDTNSIAHRRRISELLHQLKALTQDYQKKQREQAIAQAKLAWRSTWTTD
jgi:hypothetical protein